MDNKHTSTIEQYKKTCSKRIVMCGGILMFLGGILIIGSSIKIVPPYLSSNAADFYYGLLTGGIVACILITAVFIAKTLLSLRSEEALRAAYVKETDERACAVYQKAAFAGWRVSSIAILLAALAAGYFSLPVALTLLCAAAFSGICVKTAYVIYDKIL